MEKIKCAECGAEVSAQAKFCRVCGKPIVKPEPEEPVAKFCPACGAELPEQAQFCCICGASVNETEEQVPLQVIQQEVEPEQEDDDRLYERKSGFGIAGMIVSICALIVVWVPILDILVWVPGFVLSMIGLFKQPKYMAILGLAISGISQIIFFILVINGALDWSNHSSYYY